VTASEAQWGPRSSLERIRNALSDLIDNDRGDSFTAHCPCHDDSTASLSVTWRAGDAARGGLVLMNCHGCGASAVEIAEAVALKAADLFDDPPPKRQGQDPSERVGRSAQARRAGQRRSKQGRLPSLLFPKPKAPSEGWAEVCRYDYVDDEGRSVQEVIRKEVVDEAGRRYKKFTQRFKDERGVWRSQKPGGFTPVLFRQREVRRAVAEGVPVWVMEGEKDVQTAEAAGLVATTNAQGAGTFPADLATIFAGADVRVVLDRDQGGAARGVELFSLLTEAGAKRVQLLLPSTTTPKSDFTDHVDAGLLDRSSETLGLIPISVQVAELEELRYKALAAAETVMEACREAEGRHERVDVKNTHTEQPKVRRWATETEIRFEKARDLADELRRRVVADGGEAAHARLEEVEDIVGMAMRAAAEVHELAGMAIPPVLQPRKDAAEPTQRPALMSAPGSEAEVAPDPKPEIENTTGSVSALATGGANAAEVAQFEGARVQRPTYQLHEGRLVEVVYRDDKPPTIKEVLSIDARLVSIEIEEPLDDAVDTALLDLLDDETRDTQRQLSPTPLPQVLSYTVGYTDPASGEFLEIPIAARDYWDCRWLESLPGPPSFDSRPAGRSKVIDALKAAGQAAAGGVPQIVRHRATGWRRDEDGSWYYVHAAGGIDAHGYRPAPVSFTGSLRNYALPRPSTDAGLIRAAFRDWCAGMLDVLPDRVAVPMLGQAFRAAMGPTPTVVTMAGLPGSYKTSIASLVMHHWGLGWDRARTGASMSGNGDTSNALRLKLNATKDCLLWADDVAPGKNNDWSAAQERLQEFARMVYNGEARSRATRDGQALLDGTPPRSSAIVTSEVTPQAGSSGGERMLIIPLFRDEVSLDDLIRMDDAQGHRARAMLMASFLQWAAGRLPELRAQCKQQAASYAELLRSEGVANRPAEALSNVWSGWFLWCEWLRGVGALSDDEANQVLSRVMVALTEAWEAARDPDQPTSLGAQTRDLLRYALSSGLAYVEDVRKGGAPDWPLAARLGWTRTEIPSSMGDPTHRTDRGRNRLGYVLANPGLHDGEAQLLLDPAAFEAVLKAAASSMTSGLNVDRPSALKALCEEGTLIPELRSGRTPRYTVQRTIHAEQRRQRVVALRLWRVIGGPDDDASGESGGPGPDDGGPDGGAASQWPLMSDLLAGPCPSSDLSSRHDEETTQEKDEQVVTHLIESDTRTGPCIVCGHDGPVASDGGRRVFLHLECCETSSPFDRSRWAIRAIDTELDPDAYVPDPAPSAETLVESTVPTASTTPAVEATEVAVDMPADAGAPQAVPTTATKPNAAKGKRSRDAQAKPTQFTAALAVLHTDGVWLPDGTCRPLPEPLEHAGHLAELVYELGLGTQTSPRSDEPGQLWVTPDALRELFGINPESDELDPTKWLAEMSAQTSGTTLVDGALAEGWQIGTDQRQLSRWTRIWRGEQRGVLIVLMSLIQPDPVSWPTLTDDPAPAVFARRMQMLADAMQFPFKISAQTTGLDLASTCRVRDRKEAFAPSNPCPPAEIPNLESDHNWVRKPTADEARKRYVHAFDRGGSYAGAVAGLSMGIGDPEHFDGPVAFDKKLPGYWLIDRETWEDWRVPHPLNMRADANDGQVWVTTPTMEIATELGLTPTVHQAWVWKRHARVLDGWYERVRDARTILDTEDPDAQAARDQLKTVYTRLIGSFGSETLWRGRKGYAPERRHLIVAKARANLTRRFMQIGRDAGVWPLAVTADTLLYASDEPDPVKAWPGLDKSYGRGFGQFRWEASGLMEEHLPYLDPDFDEMRSGRWLGKGALRSEPLE